MSPLKTTNQLFCLTTAKVHDYWLIIHIMQNYTWFALFTKCSKQKAISNDLAKSTLRTINIKYYDLQWLYATLHKTHCHESTYLHYNSLSLKWNIYNCKCDWHPIEWGDKRAIGIYDASFQKGENCQCFSEWTLIDETVWRVVVQQDFLFSFFFSCSNFFSGEQFASSIA